MLTSPIALYNNWSAYDELSDTIELTEELAMTQLREIVRLRSLGVRVDYYLMDAFWYAQDGGYRTWRKPHWPDGPDRWLAACEQSGILPGLWVSTNLVFRLDPKPEWGDSLNQGGWAACMFRGGFLPDFIETLDYWYARGIRMIKFDFADLGAAPPEIEASLLPSEIRATNAAALRSALITLKAKYPDFVFIGYNGFEEVSTMDDTSTPPRKSLDTRWFEAFDSMYCGDPRPSDVPARNFWRSKDVYSDHMARSFIRQGIPPERIDNSSFMMGIAGTCYKRGKAGWRAMALLSMMRGGWLNCIYGNMELLTDDDARWLASAQSLILPLQKCGHVGLVGPMPGEGQPYGFALTDDEGGVIAVVNPSQLHASIEIPIGGSVLFHDRGFDPVLEGATITLAPEQMALIGFGSRATTPSLGVSDDYPVAAESQELQIFDGRVDVPAGHDLRVTVLALDANGKPKRLSGGSLPKGKPMSEVIHACLTQNGNPLQSERADDKVIWSGLAWAVVELPATRLDSAPVLIEASVTDPAVVSLALHAYAVRYPTEQV